MLIRKSPMSRLERDLRDIVKKLKDAGASVGDLRDFAEACDGGVIHMVNFEDVLNGVEDE